MSGELGIIGVPVLHWEHSRWTRRFHLLRPGEVRICHAGIARREIALLISLGWYLAIMAA